MIMQWLVFYRLSGVFNANNADNKAKQGSIGMSIIISQLYLIWKQYLSFYFETHFDRTWYVSPFSNFSDKSMCTSSLKTSSTSSSSSFSSGDTWRYIKETIAHVSFYCCLECPHCCMHGSKLRVLLFPQCLQSNTAAKFMIKYQSSIGWEPSGALCGNLFSKVSPEGRLPKCSGTIW